ncbi:MAG: J domain-containing protein [Anaerolineaceae bacterium]
MFNRPVYRSCRVIEEKGALLVFTPYVPALVHAIKSLPYTERKFDPARKAWLVDAKHGQEVIDWIELYAGERVSLPVFGGISGSPLPQASVQSPITRILQLRYLGACKTRDDGSVSAIGLVGDDWSAIFSERVLRSWFEGIDFDELETAATSRKPRSETLYTILGIKKSATPDELKKAFRRMALQWHPDHCKEPDAHERFIQIKTAYDTLCEPSKRARYDIGLELQAKHERQLRAQEKWKLRNLLAPDTQYRAPLRCGLVMVEGVEKLGRLEVSKIFAWEDWVNEQGQVLVTSWEAGAKEPNEMWV